MQNANDNNGVEEEEEAEEEEEENDFTRQLSILRNQGPSAFDFFDACTGFRWTSNQARQLEEALVKNNTVDELLEQVTVAYNPWERGTAVTGEDDIDSVFLQEEYHRKIDFLLCHILQNPSIKDLITNQLGHMPQTIFQLLAETKTLTSFTFESKQMQRRRPISQEMALAIAGGMARNTSLKYVTLEALVGDPLHIMMSGIGGPASSIEWLSIEFERPNPEFGDAVSRALHVLPSLKTLDICVDYRQILHEVRHDAWMDQVLYTLRQPFCTQVETLVLRGSVCLDLASSTMSVAQLVSKENHIVGVKVLRLKSVAFGDAKSLCLLWPFIGLKELVVDRPRFRRPGSNEENSDYWAELVKRNPNLEEIRIRNSGWDMFCEGLVNAVCGHPSVQTLDIDCLTLHHCPLDGAIGSQLCRVLQNAPSLQELTLKSFDVRGERAELLAASLGTDNHLQKLHLGYCKIKLAELTLILDSLIVNQEMKTFDLELIRFDWDTDETHILCQTISRVFEGNTTLVNVKLPHIRINHKDMHILVCGLHLNNTIKSIDFTSLNIHGNDACFDMLKNALLPEGPNTLSVSSIGLPCTDNSESVDDFLCRLPGMRNIEKVHMVNALSDHGKTLLLKATKEKKDLFISRGHHIMKFTRLSRSMPKLSFI